MHELILDKVVVTGGGSGIGRAVTLELSRRGADVWILGRRQEKLSETEGLCRDHPGKVQSVTCDVRQVESVEQAFSAINADGRPAALVHGAGEVWPCAAERLTSQAFSDAVATQMVGVFNVLSTWARSHIGAGTAATAICLSSAPGGRETPGLSHSSATKAGTEGLVRTWAVELGRYGLRFNVVAPGLFPFDTTLAARDSFFDTELFRANVPIGRFGAPDEIVAPIVFLLTRGAAYINGAILHVDGGMRLRPWFGFTPENLAPYGSDIPGQGAI